jgi:hypothetical protein
MVTMTKIIAFCGPKGSGKDTCAARLLTRNEVHGWEYFVKVPFAGPIKQVCRIIFGLTVDECEILELKEKKLERWPYVTPRQLLQDEANHYRDAYSPDIWVKAWDRAVSAIGEECILITDLRFPEELTKIQAMGGIVCYVNRTQAEDNLAQAMSEGDHLAMNVSESHLQFLKSHANYVIENSSDYTSTFAQVEDVVKQAYGHYTTWNVSKAHPRHTGAF